MTEHRETPAGMRVARDLEALRAVTARDIPRLEDTATALHRRAAHDTREGWLMKGMNWMKARPLIASATATAAIAAALLVVPISWQKTVGHEVKLAIAGAVDPAAMQAIAKELRTAVDATGVKVARLEDNGRTTTEFRAASGSRAGRQLQAKASAFAKALGERGIDAVASVTPRREKVSTNLYAYAADQAVTLRIDRTGKTPAELEADIRAQLEAAGLPDANVSVTQNGDETRVQIEAHSESTDGEAHEQRQFRVELGGHGDAPMDAQLHRFEVNRTPDMTDADVKAEIERQMREAGLDGTVTVENGRIEVRCEREEDGPAGARPGGPVEQKTWGELKQESGR